MRTLGIDYGTVRVGLALSDELGMLATPLETVKNGDAVARISKVILEKEVGSIVVGMPRNMDGSYGPKAEEVRKFVGILKEATGKEASLWDERLTTRSVERMLIEADVSRKRRKEVVDKLAAQQILQSWLDAQAER